MISVSNAISRDTGLKTVQKNWKRNATDVVKLDITQLIVKEKMVIHAINVVGKDIGQRTANKKN